MSYSLPVAVVVLGCVLVNIGSPSDALQVGFEPSAPTFFLAGSLAMLCPLLLGWLHGRITSRHPEFDGYFNYIFLYMCLAPAMWQLFYEPLPYWVTRSFGTVEQVQRRVEAKRVWRRGACGGRFVQVTALDKYRYEKLCVSGADWPDIQVGQVLDVAHHKTFLGHYNVRVASTRP